MNVLIASVALALAALIVWRCWANVVGRNAPMMAAGSRGDYRDAMIEPAELRTEKPWIAPVVQPVIEIKAARVRSAPVPSGEALPSPRATWTADADAELLRLMADGLSPADIASQLRRSEKAVLLRMPLLRLRQRQTAQAAS